MDRFETCFRWHGALWVLVLSSLVPMDADAMQPLEDFWRSARLYNENNVQAQAQTQKAQAQIRVEGGQLLPRFSAQGTYTRNQYGAAFTFPALTEGSQPVSYTILPQNQWDGSIILTIPVLDMTQWARRKVAKKSADATSAGELATRQNVEKHVAQLYFGLVGQQGILDASERSFDFAKRAEQIVQDRFDTGAASKLERQRARAETALAEQTLADARLQVALAARGLETLTHLTPEGHAVQAADDLHAEAPLAQWLGQEPNTFAPVRAALARAEANLSGLRAARYGYLPALSVSAQERFTNQTGLNGGHHMAYLLYATLSWKLDFSLTPQATAQKAAVEESLALLQQQRRQAQDVIFEDWHRIQADVQRCQAARQAVEATRLAAELALEQYSVGAATQLDVLQAKKEAFSADIQSVQADSDLKYQRIALRIDADPTFNDDLDAKENHP